MIRDIDTSKGPSKVNGNPVSDKGTVLRPGDVVAMGKTKIVMCNERVDKPTKFLPEDHSASVSPPGSLNAGTLTVMLPPPPLTFPTSNQDQLGLASTGNPEAPFTAPSVLPLSPVPVDLTRTSTTTATAAVAGQTPPRPAEQWNDDYLEEDHYDNPSTGVDGYNDNETTAGREYGEHGQEYYGQEDYTAQYEQGDASYQQDHVPGQELAAFTTTSSGGMRTRPTEPIKQEELESLAATLKGLTATSPTDTIAAVEPSSAEAHLFAVGSS